MTKTKKRKTTQRDEESTMIEGGAKIQNESPEKAAFFTRAG